MNPAVIQVMLGLILLVGGAVIFKAFGSDVGWLVFIAGIVLGCRGGIALSQSGAKEIGN
jgi:hypothetical protein